MKSRRVLFNLIVAAVLFLTLFATPGQAKAAGTTITVTGATDDATVANLNGNGTCDLREALQAANTNAIVGECPAGSSSETDTIAFNIPGGGVQTITVMASLIFNDDVIVDGTTQPGTSGSPLIRLDGNSNAAAGWGLSFGSAGGSYSTVKGLMLTRFLYGAFAISSDHITITGNYIGTDGINDLGGNSGLVLDGGDDIQIGGPAAADRNVIAGNITNISVYADGHNNTIQGNYIGVGADGSTTFGDSTGISFGSSVVGGATYNLVTGNVISGHGSGITSYADSDSHNTIEGNFIGTNAAGTGGVGNTTGILLLAGDGNTISNNLVSGNGTGIQVLGTSTNTNITGNKVGTDPDGMSAIPNTGYGIWLDGAPAKIGDGITPGNNLISGNGTAGIYMNGAGTGGTTIYGNKIGASADGSLALGNGNGPNNAGIYIADNASSQVAGNWIANNKNNGIFVYLSGTVAAGSTNNCFTGNVSYGANNTNSGVTLSLMENWWGDASGPYNPISYPGGLGQPVSSDVDASSFLTVPPASCAPILTPDSASLGFGNQLVKTSSTKTLILTNSGGLPLSVTSITTTAPFSILGSSTCPSGGGNLAAGASCTVVIKFAPAVTGLFTRSLTVTSNALTSPDNITLTGKGVAGTQLLKNPSFETDANLDKRPDGWSYKNFVAVTDGRDCAVRRAGACSLRLKGNNQQKIVSQVILKSGAAGDDFSFLLWSKAAGVPAGSVYRLQVQFFNGATLLSTRTMNFSAGTHNFQKAGGTFTAPSAYTKVVYRLVFKAASGTVWVDTASLRWAP